MKWKFFILIIILLLVLSCNDTIEPKDEITNTEVQIGQFKHLSLEGKFRAFYYNSDNHFIDVETYPNIYENLTIEQIGDTLFIKEKKMTQKVDFYRIAIYTNSSIESIKLLDSVELNTHNALKNSNMSFKLKNFSKFIGELATDEVTIHMKDRSLMNAKGNSKHIHLTIQDSSSFLSPYLLIHNLNLKAENRTYSEINVKDTITASVANSAKVLYYNNPVRNFSISDSAVVNHQILR